MSGKRKLANIEAPAANEGREDLRSLVRAEDSDPFRLLGPHQVRHHGRAALAIRTFRPGADRISIVWGKARTIYPAERIHPDGVFEAILPLSAIGLQDKEAAAPSSYRLHFHFTGGKWREYKEFILPCGLQTPGESA